MHKDADVHPKVVRARVLVVDDDADMRALLREVLSAEGYDVDAAGSAESALEELSEHDYDLLVTDIKMGSMDGLELLSRVRALRADLAVIIVTAFGNVEVAVEAIRRGAAQFVTKPLQAREIIVAVARALRDRALRMEVRALRREVESRYGFANVFGKSKAMRDVFAVVERVAQGTHNVLILGEPGTGKEVIAKAIHYNGPRSESPFVAVDCSAIPEALLDSELFGYVKGAFAGDVAKKGLFVEAHDGTLFLDEVAELSPVLQAKLLRVIQDKQVRPLGGSSGVPVSTRLITSSSKDLEAAVRAGRFREDLFYRLSVIPVRLPPLRERAEDIPALAERFLGQVAQELGQPEKRLSPRALDVLLRYGWPGNVRELENVIERLVALASGPVIEVADLPTHLTTAERASALDPFRELPSLHALSERYIKYVLDHVQGQKEKAAQILGINRRTLYRKRKANPDLDVN